MTTKDESNSIETLLSLDDLKPDPGNPRMISDGGLKALSASIREHGDIAGIVWNKRTGELVCGHQRFKTLKAEHGGGLIIKEVKECGVTVYRAIVTPQGEEFKIRVVDWPKKKQRLANIAANSPKIGGEYTIEAVNILKELELDFPDLHEELMLSDLLADLEAQFESEFESKEGLTDDDHVPEPPDDPISKPGDLWILGDHRLLCGDSAKLDNLKKLLGGCVIDLVNMDPPYNVKVEPRSNNAIAAGNSSFKSSKRTHHQSLDLARHPNKNIPTHNKLRAKDRQLKNDFMTDVAFDEILLAWFNNAAHALKPGGSFYIWGGYANLGNYPGPLKAAGFYFSQAIVWDKEHPVLWAATNAAWVYVDIEKEIYPQAALMAVYFAMAIYGIFKWR